MIQNLTFKGHNNNNKKDALTTYRPDGSAAGKNLLKIARTALETQQSERPQERMDERPAILNTCRRSCNQVDESDDGRLNRGLAGSRTKVAFRPSTLSLPPRLHE